MTRLKEHVWTLGIRSTSDEALARSAYDFEEGFSHVRVWAAYLPLDPPQIVSSMRHRGDEDSFLTLSVHLRRHEPEALSDYLYALSESSLAKVTRIPASTSRSSKACSI